MLENYILYPSNSGFLNSLKIASNTSPPTVLIVSKIIKSVPTSWSWLITPVGWNKVVANAIWASWFEPK